MLRLTSRVEIPAHEIEFEAIRAQGAGGQNVNKVASAVHLRFAIASSSLPAAWKERLTALRDRRITREGIVIIKAQRHRTLERNRDDALERLRELLLTAAHVPVARKATRPSRGAQERRLEHKARHARTKRLRAAVDDDMR